MNATEKTVILNEIKEKSNEAVVRYNSKGESIESQKAKVPLAVACQAKAKSSSEEKVSRLPQPKVATESQNEVKKDEPKHEKTHHNGNKLDMKSSSVEAHAMRFDHNGNTFEEYKDTDEHHDNQLSDETHTKKKRKRSKKVNFGDDDDEKKHNINSLLNEKVVNKQIQIRNLADDDDDDDDEHDEEDIPLITIPMVDILKQYQRMAQGYVSSTEEYSDELETTNQFDDLHLKNILHKISDERKKVRLEKKEGKLGKSAALRVIEKHMSGSVEEL